jgi:hypothetical protein
VVLPGRGLVDDERVLVVRVREAPATTPGRSMVWNSWPSGLLATRLPAADSMNATSGCPFASIGSIAMPSMRAQSATSGRDCSACHCSSVSAPLLGLTSTSAAAVSITMRAGAESVRRAPAAATITTPAARPAIKAIAVHARHRARKETRNRKRATDISTLGTRAHALRQGWRRPPGAGY